MFKTAPGRLAVKARFLLYLRNFLFYPEIIRQIFILVKPFQSKKRKDKHDGIKKKQKTCQPRPFFSIFGLFLVKKDLFFA
jgi:hypothetical protein